MSTYAAYIKSKGLFAILLPCIFLLECIASLIILAVVVDIPDLWFGVILLVDIFLIILGAWYFAQIGATAKVSIELSDSYLYLSWKKHYWLSSRAPLQIGYSDIEFCNTADPRFLIIQLQDGTDIQLRPHVVFVGKTTTFHELINDLAQHMSHPAAYAAPQPFKKETVSEGDNSYTIKSTSVLAGFISFFLIFSAVIVPLFACVAAEVNGGVLVLVIIISLSSSIYIVTKKIFQEMTLSIFDERISVKYLRKPFFDRVQDRDIYFDNIESYKITTYNGYFFTLYLKDHSKFKMMVGQNRSSTSFLAATVAIIAKIDARNLTVNKETAIARKETIYEGTSGLIIAIILIITILGMLYAIIFLPDEHTTADVFRGIGVMISLLAMLAYIISLRIKKK